MQKTNVINVAVVDDQQLFSDSIELMLKSFEDVNVVGTAQSGDELFELLKQQQVDVLLLDLEIPSSLGDDGFAIASKLKNHGTYQDIRILTVSINNQSFAIRKMIKDIKVDGYVDKNTSSKNDLYTGIKTVMDGQVYISKNLKDKLLRVMDIERLTKREIEVLELIINDYSNKEISQELFIAEKTVDNHRQSIYRKLNCKKVSELARKYYRFMYLQSDEMELLPNFKKSISNTEEMQYNRAILAKYNNERYSILKRYLANPTPANIKRRLIEIVNEPVLSDEDERIIRNFLNISNDASLLIEVKKDTEVYKAVQNFLLGKTERANKPGLIDLAALLVDYHPRPVHSKKKRLTFYESIMGAAKAADQENKMNVQSRTVNQYGDNCIYIENISGTFSI